MIRLPVELVWLVGVTTVLNIAEAVRRELWPRWRRAGPPPYSGRHAAEEPRSLPERSYEGELTGWQRRMAAEIAAERDSLPEGARNNGRALADHLRLGVPGAPDLMLAASTLTVLDAAMQWYTQPGLDEAAHHRLLTDALGIAAVELTALERV